MEIYRHELDHDVLVVAADGGLDAASMDDFHNAIQKVVDSGVRKVIVDCEKLSYISSAGIGVLVLLHKRMRAQGADVKVAGARSMILDVLAITRLDKFFDMHPDVNRARLAFRQPDVEGA